MLVLRVFDGHGNYSIGIDDITIFPEIEVDKVKHSLGMDITIVTSAKNNDDAHELIKNLGCRLTANDKRKIWQRKPG